MIEVLQPGALTTIQDLGRKGFEQYGIPQSGPLDPFLAAVANRLAGNDPNAALLEFALTGPTLRFASDCFVAIAGPPLNYLLGQGAAPLFRAFRVAGGMTLQFQKMDGWFGYVAVEGGLQVSKILGSASTYLAGNMGSRLRKGQILKRSGPSGQLYAAKNLQSLDNTINVVRIVPGLHYEIFKKDRDFLVKKEYRISTQSNRMGIRLEGPAIQCARIRRSVPTLAGTVQINRSGQPMILGPEGPTTGGYPQIANLSTVAWTALAFSGPGKALRFEWTGREEARQLLQVRLDWLQSKEAFEPL